MTEMSRGFNFDDFDEQIREALEDNDGQMAEVYALSGLRRALRPGEIGGVVATPLYQEWFGTDEFPDDAA